MIDYSPHRVLIIGGGFGGLKAALALRRPPVEVTLIDKRNFHLFQPLLYQVATGQLSPANIAAPLRSLLRRRRNCRVWMGEVVDIDVANRTAKLGDGAEAPYDTLIVAAGARHSYFGHDEWEPHAPGLKTIEDATRMRQQMLVAFERAERTTDPEVRKGLLTFVIVGAGPTGVELAGALSEVARHTLKHEFRTIDPTEAQILLVEAGPKPLSMYPQHLIDAATRDLARLHVTLRTGTMVTQIEPDWVTFKVGEKTESIRAHTVLWAAGVQASPLGKKLASATGVETDRAGRVPVQPDLTIAGHPEIFVIGDLANCPGEDGKPLPGLAPVAMQQGEYVAKAIYDRLEGRTTSPFHYRDWGSMAVIGRGSAIGVIKRWHVKGFVAWLIWLFIHLMSIMQFANRLLVLIQWGYSYLLYGRSARLITGEVELEDQDVGRPHEP